jgi:predicted Zn finger-like uncharacterized protein
MPVIQCPDCGKSLKVSDNVAGKRVRCPGCQNPFVAPDAPVVELVEEEEEEERVTTRPAADRRPKARRNDEEEEDRPRRRRPRNEDREDISVSSVPLIYGIGACLLSCIPIIGFALGGLAFSKANAEMDTLPGSKRAHAARKQLQLAKTLGIVGMCLSGIALVIIVILNVVKPIR